MLVPDLPRRSGRGRARPSPGCGGRAATFALAAAVSTVRSVLRTIRLRPRKGAANLPRRSTLLRHYLSSLLGRGQATGQLLQRAPASRPCHARATPVSPESPCAHAGLVASLGKVRPPQLDHRFLGQVIRDKRIFLLGNDAALEDGVFSCRVTSVWVLPALGRDPPPRQGDGAGAPCCCPSSVASGHPLRVSGQGPCFASVIFLFLLHFCICFAFFFSRQQWAGGRREVLGEAAGLETALAELGCGPWSPASAGRTRGMALSARAAVTSPISFLSLRPGGRKPRFFPPLLRPAPEEGLLAATQRWAATGPHPDTSPWLLSPRFPLCRNL